MTEFVSQSHFDKDDNLNQGILGNLVVESAAGIMDKVLPTGLISDKTQNVTTVLYTGDEGQILRTKLALAGKVWSKKVEAARLFSGAPAGAKLVIKNLDVASLEFPPGEKASLWLSSTDFDWTVNKTNNKEGGTFTDTELDEMGISQWSIRVHVVVSPDPTIATLKWVAIPLQVGDLSRLPGDAKKPGYPTVALSDGEANMTGAPDVEQQEASLVGIPFYPCLVNEAGPSSDITIPSDEDIISAMKVFWRSGTTVRNMKLADWTEATRGPGEPSSDRGTPSWAWPPAEPAEQNPEERDSSEPSEDEEEPHVLSAAQHDAAEAERIAKNARRELGMGESGQADKAAEEARRKAKSTKKAEQADKSPRRSRKPGDKEKRSDRTHRSSCSPSPSRSEDPTLSSPERKKKRKERRSSVEYLGSARRAARAVNGGVDTSELLAQHLWPDGYDCEKINKISLDSAMKLKKLQDKAKKDDDERAPGVSISKPDKPIKTVNIAAGTDNATTILHEARFKLRPIMSPPKEWWEKMEKKRKDAPSNPNVSFLGAAQEIPPSTFRMINDRRLTLSSKHFFGKNFGVESRTARNKTSLRGGKVESTMEYDYAEVSSMADMMNVITNYMVALYFSWQEDYTPIIVLKIATKYKFFRAAGTDALAVFNSFFNRVLAYNANNVHTEKPADIKVADDIAVQTLTAWGYSTVPPFCS